MQQYKYLFIDRDGTLIKEPEDYQVDSLDKLDFMEGVFDVLRDLSHAGFKLVMITNQDGLGTASFPQSDFDPAHNMMLKIFLSQGIQFEDVLICPHLPEDKCHCRKPEIGLLIPYLTQQCIDLKQSYVVGDRDTDIELAARLNIEGIKIATAKTPDWHAVRKAILQADRKAKIQRKTNETDITVSVNLDQNGIREIDTGIGFFDHMLDQIAKHGGFSVDIKVKGDLEVDDHHSVEDVAISLSEAISQALGDKYGINRYGFLLPMDESEAKISLDLSGRAFCQFNANFPSEKVGMLSTEMVSHFFSSFAAGLKATLHLSVTGENTHHMVEAAFKALGKVLAQAIERTSKELPSTKGVL
ncbi:bifunctional histidinol-phosphatase/imidazoleglycerol-phosphate dehydratase HisB [Fangia hongkongensis]|uniref:bifunctional histidinol-phosphatase/imidazoleglycerol-phosphate dehydratase HisB n=2 Tax=Fangia hongkongensis TaxID=270495 RepID=UPI00035C212A|nr:bifunctional histidinol-phosphatase/imidazoleglycerol-phosphate dehydratase HisB [Fangia hongkongensis]